MGTNQLLSWRVITGLSMKSRPLSVPEISKGLTRDVRLTRDNMHRGYQIFLVVHGGYEIFLDVIGGVPNIICTFLQIYNLFIYLPYILNWYRFNSFSDLFSKYATMYEKIGVAQPHKRQNFDNSPKFVSTEINIFTNRKVLLKVYQIICLHRVRPLPRFNYATLAYMPPRGPL